MPFLSDYVNQLSSVMEHNQKVGMTCGYKRWLAFCLTCIIITNSICWCKFARISLGSFSDALLSWYFRHPMTWELLLSASVKLVLECFEIKEGVLLIDET